MQMDLKKIQLMQTRVTQGESNVQFKKLENDILRVLTDVKRHLFAMTSEKGPWTSSVPRHWKLFYYVDNIGTLRWLRNWYNLEIKIQQ